VTLQAALLVRHAPAAVADAFCASRLGSGSLGWGTLSGPAVPFGTLPDDVATGAILDRATASSR
jgi:putative acyl-CoA dehydrogenase